MAEKIKNLADWRGYQGYKPPPGSLASGGDGPHDGDMEARVARLEETMSDVRERLARIETRVDATATKADLSDLKADLMSAINAQTWRILGLLVALVGAAIAIAKFVH